MPADRSSSEHRPEPDAGDAGEAGESGAGALSEAQRRSARTAMDGAGAYVRDEAGVWHDARDGSVVPHARDLTLGDLYDPPLVDAPPAASPAGVDDLGGAGDGDGDGDGDGVGVDGGPVRIVPRAWASRHPDHPLAWVFEHADLGSREPIAIPAATWDERAATVVAMDAPELHPVNLVGPDGVAELLGVAAGTVRAYLARDQLPAPIGRIGGSPVWPRALIERWMRSRRAGVSATAPS